MESVQHNVALTITEAIKFTSRDKLYKELGLETIKLRSKYSRIFYEIKTADVSTCLFGLIPNTTCSYQTRTLDIANADQYRIEAYKSSFFPGSLLNYATFKKPFILEFRPVPNYVFNIHNPILTFTILKVQSYSQDYGLD